jgi:hypothetical protein
MIDLGKYDEGLGISDEMLSYIEESHALQAEISHDDVYMLLRRHSIGEVTGSLGTWVETLATSDYCVVEVWNTGSVQARPDLHFGVTGSLQVLTGSTPLTRVVEYQDLLHDNEFAVMQDLTRSDQRISVVFNEDYDATLGSFTYHYNAIAPHYAEDTGQPASAESPDYNSMYGWQPWTGSVGNTVKVRLPITPDQLTIDEQGRVTLKDNNCWMLAPVEGSVPYVDNWDMIVIPATDHTPETRFHIYEKMDSWIQGRHMHQRFKIQFIDFNDPRYRIPITL